MSKETPKLSIITVCYNNCEGLRKTMESVKTQTFKDYEYIVIDGGSTDGTVELIKENEQHIDYWVSEKDSGIYNAMNKGIEAAKGKYCYFLNSDDYIAVPNTLEKIFEQVKGNPDIIYGNLAVRKGDKLCYVVNFSKNITPYSFYRFKPAIHHQASFSKKELFQEYGNYDEEKKINADWFFFFQMTVLHKVKIQYINQIFAVFLADGMSSSNNNDALRTQEVRNIKKETFLKYLQPKQLKKYENMKRLTDSFFVGKIQKVKNKLFLIKAKLKKEI